MRLACVTMAPEAPMPLITDDQIRQDIKQRLDGAKISMEELGVELGLSKGRISQILKEGPDAEDLPLAFPAKAIRAMQRIIARRGAFAKLSIDIDAE